MKTVTETIEISYDEPEKQDSTENDDESNETQRIPNSVKIYIEDQEHTLGTVYKQFEISEDTEVELTFVLQEGEKGKYKIVKDGETIEEDEVSS